MTLSKNAGRLLVLGGLGLAVLGQVLPTGPLVDTPTWLIQLTQLWLPAVIFGGLLYAYDTGAFQSAVGDAEGVLNRSTGGPLERHEVIAATNWKRVNSIVFRRSLGASLAVAGLVAFVLSVTLGASQGGSASTGLGIGAALVWVVAMLVGLMIFLTSRTTSEEIEMDYTHRVSVRVPDLFSVHSFHVHLRQIAEDLGYVVSEKTSPGRGGSAAAFDDEVFLSKGGFKARKRPISPSISFVPEDSPLAEVLNLTTVSMVLTMVGLSMLVTGPRGVGLVSALVGAALFVYDYVRRTRQWAELYCIEEGTVYTPTANVHEDDPPEEGVVHREPAVSAAESSTEMIVTLGARNSVYFDDDRLVEDFEAVVSRLDEVAQENSYTVLDEQAQRRPAPQTEHGR
ncbi:MAG: hypothetical protein ABEJ40_08660 [Haloarculaceae archaeon]